MIEQEITLLTNGRISFPKCGNGLQFGYTKNRGVYSLKVKITGEWQGLAIRAIWHIPDVKEPITSLLVDNVIQVPALVTSYKGEGRIVFEGSDGNKTVTSADVHYYVNKNSGTYDGTIPEPGTPAWQEFIAAVKKDSDTAVEARNDATKSAEEAKQALEETKATKDQAMKDIGAERESAIEAIDNKKNSSIDEINEVKEDAKEELIGVRDTAEEFISKLKESVDKAAASESAAKQSEMNAKESETLSEQYKNSASNSAISAQESKESASQSETNALGSADRAAVSEANAKLSETASDNSAKKAFDSETKAKASEVNAGNSATNAEHSATNASASADAAKDSEEKAKASEIVSTSNASEVAKNLETINGIKAEIDVLDADVNAKAASVAENASNSKSSADEAKLSETNAATSEANALESENKAKISETNSKVSEDAAKLSADSAEKSKISANESETKARASEDAAKLSEENAKSSETVAVEHANRAVATLQELKDGIASGDFKGEAATIKIGTVTGLDSGSAPTVVNSGDEQNAIFDFGLPTASAIDLTVTFLFKLSRTGKVYTVKIPKFASNSTTICEKMDDNAGLICEPSTDTVEGRDDYADIPLFKWYNCNYKRDKYGHAYPTAIEGLSDDYSTTGTVDVGVVQMTPYVKWDESNEDYTILSITDKPRDGYVLWCEANSNGVNYPYVVHSKYFSGVAEDGLLRSQPDLIPARNQSYNNQITEYAKKGDGYFGAIEARNTWQIIFTLIKYAQKSSQKVFAGCTNYNFQFKASIQRDTEDTFFPVTKQQASQIAVASYLSVGYGRLNVNNNTVSNDRSLAEIHSYGASVKVLRIEDIDDSNSAIYLDVEKPFSTMPVALSDTVNADIMLTSMHWRGAGIDSVLKNHDGSPTSNTNAKCVYRVQGVEYAAGGWFAPSDVVMDFQSDYSKNVLVCDKSTKRSSSDAVIRSTYKNVGNILSNDGNDFWIGDISLNLETGVSYPSSVGTGDATGVGDRCWTGGKQTSGTREYLRGGTLHYGSYSGSSCLSCGDGLWGASWDYLSAD